MATIRFKESPTPGLESGVWILQLLAESLHGILAADYQLIAVDCARNELGLADIVRILGGFAGQRLPNVGNNEKTLVQDREKALSDIWSDFLNESRIQRLTNKTRGLFQHGSAETKNKLRKDGFDFSWLERAHSEALGFINDFLKSRALEGIPSAPEVKVLIVEDREARMFCARTQTERGQILWAHQNVAHALTNMVIAERVLAHEYLSHVLPRNRALGGAVTEQWLVALLQQLYEQRAAAPYWPRAIFRALRLDIEQHVAGKEKPLELIRSLGVRGVESAASDLLESAPERFWHFTDALLTVSPEEDVEQVLVELMGYLAIAGPEAVEAALTRKYSNISELHEILAL